MEKQTGGLLKKPPQAVSVLFSPPYSHTFSSVQTGRRPFSPREKGPLQSPSLAPTHSSHSGGFFWCALSGGLRSSHSFLPLPAVPGWRSASLGNPGCLSLRLLQFLALAPLLMTRSILRFCSHSVVSMGAVRAFGRTVGHVPHSEYNGRGQKKVSRR